MRNTIPWRSRREKSMFKIIRESRNLIRVKLKRIINFSNEEYRKVCASSCKKTKKKRKKREGKDKGKLILYIGFTVYVLKSSEIM